jgi:Tat protein secretion system quality control protein TatD with DNase activity
MVEEVPKKIAEIKKMTVEKIINQVEDNSRILFKV